MKKVLSLILTFLLPMVSSVPVHAYDYFQSNGINYYIIDNNSVEVSDGKTIYSGALVIPNQVTYLGTTYSVTSIGYEAFMDCSGLTSITIPNSVTSIEGQAFWGCSALTSITIGNSVTYIGDWAFNGCSGLTSVHITDLEAWCKILFGEFGEYESNPLYYAHHLYMNGSEITNMVIPNSVTSIGDRAFVGCSGLTSITIPNSVTSIGNSAFYNCGGLNSIKSLKNTPPTCTQDYYGNYTQFNSVDKTNCVVWVPKGSANAYKEADGWKDFQNIRELAYGDVNLDFEVNQADLDATTDHIMGQDQEGFYESLADLNNDEAVNAADVVKLVTILNIQDGLSLDWDYSYNSSQMVSSLSCTLNNDGDKTIQLTKCELYNNNKLVRASNFKVTLAPGESKSRTFSDLASLSVKTGISVVWYYTYNGESYTYNCDLTE